MKTNVLFLDNVDSFVYNLVDEFARRGCEVNVWRNTIAVERILKELENLAAPKLLVISPGPGTPAEAGCCIELIKRLPEEIPMLGVCLGHQALVEAFGGRVGPAGEVVHGKSSMMEHSGEGIFAGLPSPMMIGRYHSLASTSIPSRLKVTAQIGDLVMAVEHESRPLYGVQFHPESILTPLGGRLLENILSLSQTRGNKPAGAMDHA